MNLPVGANILQTWGRLALALPLDPGDPAREGVAFRLEDLSPPAPMLPSTSMSTSPPPRQKSGVRTNLSTGGGTKNRTSRGVDHSRGRLLRSAHELAHSQADVTVNHLAHHILRFRVRQHTVVAEGVGTQARDRPRKRVAEDVYPKKLLPRANFSSKLALTRASSASTCPAHLARSADVRAAPTARAPEVDPESARAAAPRARRAASASSLAAARAAASGESAIVEEAAHSGHNSSHSECHSSSRSESRSQQQSQRITAAPNADRVKPLRLRNQPVCIAPRTYLADDSSLHASLACQRPGRLIQGSTVPLLLYQYKYK